jgi:hypothetical protein
VAADLDGWRRSSEYVETVFEMGMSRVEGHTAVYEDTRLTDAGREAGLGEGPWRFFFTTDLQFQPPLAPGIGPASVLPSVVTESARSFAADLRDRGFEAVERGRRERARTRGGDRLRLRQFTATYPTDGVRLDVEGWLGVWAAGGEVRIAGGAYPTSGFDAFGDGVEDLAPGSFRDELLALIRSVE